MLVIISIITTPTQAYEAYNFSNVHNFEQEFINKSQVSLYPRYPVPVVAEPVEAIKPIEDVDMCRLAIDEVENEFQIKKNLLKTIASVESGRWNRKRGERISWPWTVHANGKGYYFKTKTEAVNAVKSMQANGVKNIDVGCMQINLRYHGNNFNNLEEAFEPKNNVAYGAKFLKKLYKRNNNWEKTAMQYHSKNFAKGSRYKNRLEKHFAQYVKQGNEVLF